MNKLIFAIVIFAYVLSQCKKTEEVSSKNSDGDLVNTADDAETTKHNVGGVFQSDSASSNPMKVIPGDSTDSIFIQAFYEGYLLGLENGSADSVKRKYCTSELIAKIENGKLDYDPILNAQDFDDNLLNTLDVKKSDDPQGYYLVSYLDGYTKSRVYIVLKLVEHEGGLKIADIALDFGPEKK